MWLWFHSGWIIVLPLVMVALCIVMFILMRRHVLPGCGMCCHGEHRQFHAQVGNRPPGDSGGPTT